MAENIKKLREELEVVKKKASDAIMAEKDAGKYLEDIRNLQLRIAKLEKPENVQHLETLQSVFNKMDFGFIEKWIRGRADKSPGEVTVRLNDGVKYRLLIRTGKA